MYKASPLFEVFCRYRKVSTEYALLNLVRGYIKWRLSKLVDFINTNQTYSKEAFLTFCSKDENLLEP